MDLKYPIPLSKPWAFFEWNDIPSKLHEGKVYLRRLRVIQTPLFSVMVHQIEEPDTDQDPHDHPWNFSSVILRGGYWESYWPNPGNARTFHQRVRHRWSWAKTPITTAHQITEVYPRTVTLVFAGKRVREWGFWVRHGAARKFVLRREYLNGEYTLDELC